MGKILIVNNNLMIGGIQKSLINLLKGVHDKYDVTLLLFSDYGELIKDVPSDVKILYAHKRLKILGTPWDKLKKSISNIYNKFFSLFLCKVFGKDKALDFLFKKQKKIQGFDHVISYSHCQNEKSIAISTAEFVLRCTESKDKICWIHCDYKHSDTYSKHNNALYMQFDKIACCSDSVKNNFLSLLPDAANKCYTVRNFYDSSILDLAKDNPFQYDDKYINIVSVARLSYEKGIDLAIDAIKDSQRNDIRYYIVGDGPEEAKLKEMVDAYKLDNIFFLGAQVNPYRYMKNADYLLVPSRHEAAPMVFDEANILGLPVISTETTSAREMIEAEYINNNILKVLTKIKKSEKTENTCFKGQLQQFRRIIG